MLADVYTPVGIYLRLRDRFRDTILLESSDSHAAENSYSFIGINAIAGVEISNNRRMEFKLPGQNAETTSLKNNAEVLTRLHEFMDRFTVEAAMAKPANVAQGLFGYCSFEAVQFFEDIKPGSQNAATDIPLMRYRLYQYVIAIDHHKDELYLCENMLPGISSEMNIVESLIRNRDVPIFPFAKQGAETSSITDAAYIAMVQKGIAACKRGDVFQVVLSRRFEQNFSGDEFNVYRALRSVNPSPYLFYFDYGDYKLMGSSPESQLIMQKGTAVVHPIAGTFRRTGNDEEDKALATALEADPKENAEHVMLVDLARNDLSRLCSDVQVTRFRQTQYYSHVIHLVSEVSGQVKQGTDPFLLLGSVFPAGTLSGAPKIRAMQLIRDFEQSNRGYYGGAIGCIGFDGSINHAIMIRSFLCRDNKLVYQAGAGVVAVSVPENELQEVNNKLNALKTAINMAENI